MVGLAGGKKCDEGDLAMNQAKLRAISHVLLDPFLQFCQVRLT